MHCPQFIVSDNKYVFVTLNAKWDYLYFKQVPLSERLNPLRYEFILAPFTKYRTVINKDGALAIKFSNLIFRIKGKLIKEDYYRISVESHWLVDRKSIIDLEREALIANGSDPDDIKVEMVRMTRNQFEMLKEHQGF